jgi:uncharacterized protein YqgC (DUF456 family)
VGGKPRGLQAQLYLFQAKRPAVDFFWAAMLLVALLVGWVLTVLSLPGNWLIVGAAAIYAWFYSSDSHVAFEWPWLVALVLLALVGEGLELIAGALGVKKGGGSKRAALLAIGGSVVGSIVGALLGLPIPVIGSLIAVLLCASLGALGGAMLGEAWKGRDWAQGWQVGQGAFWGRLAGSLAKVIVASVMVLLTIIGLLVPL